MIITESVTVAKTPTVSQDVVRFVDRAASGIDVRHVSGTATTVTYHLVGPEDAVRTAYTAGQRARMW